MKEHKEVASEDTLSHASSGYQVGETLAVDIAMDSVKGEGALKEEAISFLRAQTDLANAHRHRVESEHNFFEKVEKGAKKLALRGQSAVKVALLSGVGVFAFIFFWIVTSALTSHRVIVEPISISSNISARVPDGKIVSGMLIDKIGAIQAKSTHL
jgi:hypothetical protein